MEHSKTYMVLSQCAKSGFLLWYLTTMLLHTSRANSVALTIYSSTTIEMPCKYKAEAIEMEIGRHSGLKSNVVESNTPIEICLLGPKKRRRATRAY